MRFEHPSLHPSRFRAIAVATVVAVVALSAGPARALPPTLAGATVDFTTFSPDGDAVQDSVRYSYTLGGDTATVVVEVQRGDAAAPNGQVVVTLRNATRPPGGDQVAWSGRNAGGALQSDGYYWVVTSASNTDGTVAAVPVRVQLDTVAPQVSVVAVNNPYAPSVLGADSLARVTVNLSGVESGDQLLLTLTGPLPLALENTALFDVSSNGLFEAGWDGRDQDDGLYGVQARVFDDAGHAHEVLGPDLNLDAAPPQAVVTLPTRPDTNGTVRRVEASVTDRSGIGFARLRVTSAGGVVADSLCPCATETIGLGVDLPDSVAADDTLHVELFVRDLPGLETTVLQTILVDTIPPSPPVFDPLPQQVVQGTLSYGGTASGSDSVWVRRNGAVVARLRVATTGRFGGTLSLALGTNQIDGLAKDEAGNLSVPSPAKSVLFEQTLGVRVPERFRNGDAIRVVLEDPGRGVRVFIYTLTGRLVRTLESNSVATVYQLPWDLRDEDGSDAGSGPYVFRILVTPESGAVIEQRVAAVVTR